MIHQKSISPTSDSFDHPFMWANIFFATAEYLTLWIAKILVGLPDSIRALYATADKTSRANSFQLKGEYSIATELMLRGEEAFRRPKVRNICENVQMRAGKITNHGLQCSYAPINMRNVRSRKNLALNSPKPRLELPIAYHVVKSVWIPHALQRSGILCRF